MHFSARLFSIAIAALLISVHSQSAYAAHALALGATPKYPENFSHFDYANPNAPRGGEIVLANPDRRSSFDSFNPFIIKGLPSAGIGALMFESLATASADEPATVYGLLAKDMMLAPDKLSITFTLHPKAKFSNGDPVTAEDVKFSYETLISKEAAPQFRSLLADVKRAVVVDTRTIRYEFKQVNSELPLIVAGLPVFSPKWLKGRTIDKVALEAPIASGPYLIEKHDVGRRITYRHNPNYWGWDLPVRRGFYNFERVTYIYYQDILIRLEAFKAGEFDFISEYSAKSWARHYIGPKFRNGEFVKKELKHHNIAGMQGFIMNLRRPQFRDVRVRKALGLALDYEWMNRRMFYNQYQRIYSYYSNGELAATGMPSAEELRLLEPLRKRLDPAVFGPAPVPPSTDPPSSLRNNLRQARELLAEAGWTYRDGALRNAKGEPFVFECLDDDHTGARVFSPYQRNLQKLGIVTHFRAVDFALYQRRLDDFEYDMVLLRYPDTQSPGNELVSYYHSSSANVRGSNNVLGLKDPAVDALIDVILRADTRAKLVTAVRAFDRVLLHGYYIIPQWFSATHRVAYVKRRFGMPETLPLYYRSEDLPLELWWQAQPR